jgi:hypothetical protein
MNKFIVSAGLMALGAAALDSAMADELLGDATGPKYWSVGATLRGFYDDNYAISTSQKGSFGIEFLPTVAIHVPLQQTDFGVRYTYGLYYYQDRQDVGDNPFDQTHQLDVWLDHAFNERWKGTFNDTFSVGQEPELLSPNPVTAVATPYRVNGDNISNHGNIALNTDWTRLFSTTLTYENGLYDYDNAGTTLNNISSTGASLSALLNRVEENASLDLKWHLQPDTTLFVGYQFAWVNYTGDQPIAVVTSPKPGFNGVYYSDDRDSDTHYLYVGLEEDFTPNLTGTIRGGASYNDVYSDPLNPSTTWSPYADMSLSYTYLPGSYVQLGVTHDISSTDQILPNTTGGITQFAENSVVYLDVNHRITQKLVATVIGRVQYTTYDGGAADASSDNTTDYGLGVNLSYQINPHLSVDAGYNYDDVVSDIAGYSYNRNRVYLGVTATY